MALGQMYAELNRTGTTDWCIKIITSFKKQTYIFVCVCVHVCAHATTSALTPVHGWQVERCIHATVHVWRSVGNSVQVILSSISYGPWGLRSSHQASKGSIVVCQTISFTGNTEGFPMNSMYLPSGS